MPRSTQKKIKDWNNGRIWRLFHKGWNQPPPSKPPQTGPVNPAKPVPGDRMPLPAKELPHKGLVTDPMLSWAKAQEGFAQQQISDGFSLMRDNRPIDNLADHAQLEAARATLDPLPPADGRPTTTTPKIPDRPLPVEPLQANPLSTTGALGVNPVDDLMLLNSLHAPTNPVIGPDPMAPKPIDDPMAPAPLIDPMAPKPGG